MSDVTPYDLLQPRSDFALRNRYLSRIGAKVSSAGVPNGSRPTNRLSARFRFRNTWYRRPVWFTVPSDKLCAFAGCAAFRELRDSDRSL